MKVLFVFNHGVIVGGGEISFLRLISSFVSGVKKGEFTNLHFGIYIPSYNGQRSVFEALKKVLEENSLNLADDFSISNQSFSHFLFEKSGVKISFFSFPLPPVRAGFVKGLFDFLKMLKNFLPDVVHVNGSRAMFYSGVSKTIGKALKDMKTIWHVRVKNKDFIDPILYLLSDGVIVNSKKTAQRFEKLDNFFRRWSRSKIRVIYNGVELSLRERVFEIKKSGKDKEIKDRLKIPPDVKVVSSAGRIEDGKGFEEFLMSASVLMKSKRFKSVAQRTFFLLAGDGPKKDKFIYLFRKNELKNFVLPGFMKVEELFAISDVFVFPSLLDGFGNLVLESMVSGVPAIVSSLSGASEIVDDGKDALIVNPRNFYKLSEMIYNLLSDDRKREEIAKNAFEKAKKFSIDEHRNKVFNFYLELTGIEK